MNIFNKQPFLIAEIGVNFYDIAEKEGISDMDAAKLMIDEAKNAALMQLSSNHIKLKLLLLVILRLIGIYQKSQQPHNLNYSKNLINSVLMNTGNWPNTVAKWE